MCKMISVKCIHIHWLIVLHCVYMYVHVILYMLKLVMIVVVIVLITTLCCNVLQNSCLLLNCNKQGNYCIC